MIDHIPVTRLSSSLRSRGVDESLQLAEALAMQRGVSRVVDTTWLDSIGIPVYASIRPDGLKGSICVHAGKGFTHSEAKIGAFMEAIEFSFAPPGRSDVTFGFSSPREIVASFDNRIHFAEFAPRMSARVTAADQVATVEADEIFGLNKKVLVPAELVYHPFFENQGVKLYGTSTNGLASGNNVKEATVHGLAEVMERHVRSFEVLDDKSELVPIEGTPAKVQEMARRIRDAGMTCYLRYSANEFGLPYFAAYVLEPDEHSPLSVASGFGFHAIAEIAAVRALAEAVQGRLSYIHGGRDDLIKKFKSGELMGRETELRHIRFLREIASRDDRVIPFDDVPSKEAEIHSIDDAQDVLFRGLIAARMNHVARVVFTPADYPFQVVKIVVPGAEMYEHELKRVGPRLLKHFSK